MSSSTSKHRALTAISHRIPDRVPVNYYGNAGIDQRLREHFHTDDILSALGVDFRSVYAPYIGPPLHPQKPGIRVDEWGIHQRWVEHPFGGYWDYCVWPLRDASPDAVAAWPMPNPDHFDYAAAASAARRAAPFCVCGGGAGWPDVINGNSMLRTMEQLLIDLATDDEAGVLLVDRRNAIQLEIARRTLEAAPGAIDVLCLGEDLGTQRGPMINLDLFRRHIRPRMQPFVDLARAHGIPAMVHSCGSSSWAFDDFIEMGVSVVETLQPEAADMSPRYLKQRYGDRLAFHGCISTAGPLATGTPDDVERVVRDTLEVMMPGGGYILSPTHLIQDNTPTENVLRLYAVAHSHGTYHH